MLVNALLVPEGTSDSKATKTECEWKLNDHTTPTTDSLGLNQFQYIRNINTTVWFLT